MGGTLGRGSPLWITGLYAAVLATGMAHHELWRDELQAWMLARDSTGP